MGPTTVPPAPACLEEPRGRAGCSEGEGEACSAQGPRFSSADLGCKTALGPFQFTPQRACQGDSGCHTHYKQNLCFPQTLSSPKPPLALATSDTEALTPLRAPSLETISQDCWGPDMRREGRGLGPREEEKRRDKTIGGLPWPGSPCPPLSFRVTPLSLFSR